MAPTPSIRSGHGSHKNSSDFKEEVENVEAGTIADTVLERYPLLKDKSKDELEALNKKVLRKLDWRFLPCITMMLLMK